MDMRSLAVESVTLEVNETASLKAVMCGGTTAFMHFIHGGLLLLLVCSNCCCRCSIVVDVSISILDGSYHVVQKNVIAFAYSDVVDDDDECSYDAIL